MKRFVLFLAFAVSLLGVSSKTHAAQNYSVGNLLVGIGIGGGNADYVHGVNGLVLNPSVEIIFGTWNANGIGLALGGTVNSSILFGAAVTGSLTVNPTFHVTIANRLDWYVGLGYGQTLQGNWVRYGAAFQTGFNIVASNWFLVNIGLELQGTQFFGVAGVKFRFGNYGRPR